jgi:hypothetical protein
MPTTARHVEVEISDKVTGQIQKIELTYFSSNFNSILQNDHPYKLFLSR